MKVSKQNMRMHHSDSLHSGASHGAASGDNGAPAGGGLPARGAGKSAASKALPVRRLIAFAVFVLGLWIYSDWLLVWAGYSQVTAVPATVVNEPVLSTRGKGSKYFHLIRYQTEAKTIERQLVLGSRHASGSQVNIEHFAGKPGKLYKVNGRYRFSDAKLYYLLGAFIVVASLVSHWRHQRKVQRSK